MAGRHRVEAERERPVEQGCELDALNAASFSGTMAAVTRDLDAFAILKTFGALTEFKLPIYYSMGV